MSVEIDMREVAAETAESLGMQIGNLTAELVAARLSNRALHEEVDRLRQALAAAGETQEPGETDAWRNRPGDKG